MSKHNFRQEEDSSVVLKLITDIMYENMKVYIWQQQDKGRIIKKAIVEDISIENNCLFFILDEGEQEVHIDGNRGIYITNNDNTIAFNANILMVDNTQLIAGLPKKLILPENRAIPRFVFPKNKESKVFLSYGNTEKIQDTEYFVKNISPKGACLEVPQKFSAIYYKDESLSLSWKHEDKLMKIEGKSAHLTNLHGSYLLGISFNKEVSEQYLESLKKAGFSLKKVEKRQIMTPPSLQLSKSEASASKLLI